MQSAKTVSAPTLLAMSIGDMRRIFGLVMRIRQRGSKLSGEISIRFQKLEGVTSRRVEIIGPINMAADDLGPKGKVEWIPVIRGTEIVIDFYHGEESVETINFFVDHRERGPWSFVNEDPCK